jgi:hypothetical protein
MRQRTFRTYLVILILLGSMLSRGAAAQERVAGEYQVKAAMLYNMAKFVDWPNEKTGSDQTPFKICIIGRNPFGTALDPFLGNSIRGRRLMISQVSRPEEVGACQLLFVSYSERRNLAAILDTAGRRRVLTVSDIDRFAASGGMIGFVESEGRIRMEVNMEAVRNADLWISSQLLKLTRIVKGEE